MHIGAITLAGGGNLYTCWPNGRSESNVPQQEVSMRTLRLWRRRWAENTFPDEETALAFLQALRWPNGPACPKCGSADVQIPEAADGLFRCRTCRRRFSVRTGSIFGHSKLPLRTWLIALRLVVSHPTSISSAALARDLGVTQTTAWRILDRFAAAIGIRGTRFADAQKIALLNLVLQSGRDSPDLRRSAVRGRGSPPAES